MSRDAIDIRIVLERPVGDRSFAGFVATHLEEAERRTGQTPLISSVSISGMAWAATASGAGFLAFLDDIVRFAQECPGAKITFN